MRRVGLALLALALVGAAPAPNPPRYDPRAAFAAIDWGQAINRYRSGSGVPGPDYWSNRADYRIQATLDPASHSLTGEETIRYTNNSPDALDRLWVQLDQNLYRPYSRGSLAEGGTPRGTTQGYRIASVAIEAGGRLVPVDSQVSDTRMAVLLPQPLAGHGGVVLLHIRWSFTIPPGGVGGRMGWGPTRSGGETYDLAQWYPRMAVYDDVRGWDPLPYLAQEFYLDYGDFDYAVTVPADMIVAGSGALQNPEQVLTAQERARLARAAESDATVKIVSVPEIGSAEARPTRQGTLTWRFHMANTRDVAFSASNAFAWDAARIRLPGGGHALAMSYYPAEAAGPQDWDRSTQYVKDTVENMSRRWYPYPWPAAINVAGPASGMEYPGIVFDGPEDKGKPLFWITAHEIGHDWFPMIVGFDERRHAWMDEGFNTFIDTFESEDFNHGEFAPKRDSEFAPGGGNPVDEILPILADPAAPPILTRADSITEKYRHPVTYFKSALGLVLLRDEILGPERFDLIFRRFIALWAYRHPQPADFFRFIDSESGEDLSWFWRGWYLTNSTYDVAVTGIGSAKDGGTLVTVENRDPMVLPVTLRVEFAGGGHQDIRLPAESWIRQTATQVPIAPGRRVIAATADPDHHLPDRDRSNNRFVVGAAD